MRSLTPDRLPSPGARRCQRRGGPSEPQTTEITDDLRHRPQRSQTTCATDHRGVGHRPQRCRSTSEPRRAWTCRRSHSSGRCGSLTGCESGWTRAADGGSARSESAGCARTRAKLVSLSSDGMRAWLMSNDTALTLTGAKTTVKARPPPHETHTSRRHETHARGKDRL